MSEPPRYHDVTAETSRKTSERRIRNRALTIGLSVTPFGLSFGAVSVEAHLNLIQVCLLSLVLFSGASQFALASIIGAGGSYFSAVGTALLLGVRNGLYGARINALLRPSGWRRFVMAEVTIDESTAMAVSETRSGHASRAFWYMVRSVGFPSKSLPPSRAATSTWRMIFANTLARVLSTAAFLCLVVAHLE